MHQRLLRYQLPLERLRGQTYDGAPNMTGAYNRYQAIIRREQPLAPVSTALQTAPILLPVQCVHQHWSVMQFRQSTILGFFAWHLENLTCCKLTLQLNNILMKVDCQLLPSETANHHIQHVSLFTFPLLMQHSSNIHQI